VVRPAAAQDRWDPLASLWLLLVLSRLRRFRRVFSANHVSY